MKMPPEVRPFLSANLGDPLATLAIEAAGGTALVEAVKIWQNFYKSRRWLKTNRPDLSVGPLPWNKTLREVMSTVNPAVEDKEVNAAGERAFAREARRVEDRKFSKTAMPKDVKEAINAHMSHNWDIDGPRGNAHCAQLRRLGEHAFLRASARTFGLRDGNGELHARLTLPEMYFEARERGLWDTWTADRSRKQDWKTVFYRTVIADRAPQALCIKIVPWFLPTGNRIINTNATKSAVDGDIMLCSWLAWNDPARKIHVLGEYAYDWIGRLGWKLDRIADLSEDFKNRLPVGLAVWKKCKWSALPGYLRTAGPLNECAQSAAMDRNFVEYADNMEDSDDGGMDVELEDLSGDHDWGLLS